jgi:hypothetical protein
MPANWCHLKQALSIEYSKSMEQLEQLPRDIEQTGIDGLGDEAVAELQKLRKLKVLGIICSLASLDMTTGAFSETGAKALSGHQSIRHLLIVDAGITDVGMGALTAMTSLAELHIIECLEVSRDGVERCRQMRPDVQVFVQYPPGPVPDSE